MLDSAAGGERLAAIEAQIARLRAEQMEVIDRLRPALETQGPATAIAEFLTEAADVAPDTAEAVTALARALPSHPVLHAALAHGDITFDRAAALTRLADLGHGHSVDIGWMRSVAELCHLADLAECLIESPTTLHGETTASFGDGDNVIGSVGDRGPNAVTTSSGA